MSMSAWRITNPESAEAQQAALEELQAIEVDLAQAPGVREGERDA